MGAARCECSARGSWCSRAVLTAGSGRPRGRARCARMWGDLRDGVSGVPCCLGTRWRLRRHTHSVWTACSGAKSPLLMVCSLLSYRESRLRFCRSWNVFTRRQLILLALRRLQAEGRLVTRPPWALPEGQGLHLQATATELQALPFWTRAPAAEQTREGLAFLWPQKLRRRLGSRTPGHHNTATNCHRLEPSLEPTPWRRT